MSEQIDKIKRQIQELTESNRRMERDVQDLVACLNSFLGARQRQTTTLNEVITGLDSWISSAPSKAETQLDVISTKLYEAQEQQIKDLRGLLAEKDYELSTKNQILERINGIQHAKRQPERPKTPESCFERWMMQSGMKPVSEKSEEESTHPMSEEEPGSDEEPEEEYDLEDSVENPFSNDETRAFGEDASGVNDEEPLYESNHFDNWKKNQTSSLDLSTTSLSHGKFKVKVTNLPRDVNRQLLNSVFVPSGAIEDIIIAQKANSAIAFITFRKRRGANNALKTNTAKHFDRNVIVTLEPETKDWNQVSPPSSFSSKLKEGQWQSQGSFDSAEYVDVPTKYRPKREKTEPDCPKNRTIYLKDIPYDVTEKTLQHTFGKFGAIESIDIKRRENGQLKYAFAFIRYKTVAMAKEAKHTGTVFVMNAVVHIGSAMK